MLWLSNTVWLHIFRPLRNTVCNICIHGHSFWIFTAIFRARTTFLWLNETLHLWTASVLQREAQGGHWTRQAIVTADSRVHIQSVKMVKLRIKISLLPNTHDIALMLGWYVNIWNQISRQNDALCAKHFYVTVSQQWLYQAWTADKCRYFRTDVRCMVRLNN